MAVQRDFSDSIKLEVIKSNLKKNNGSICCEMCNTRLNTIDDCHFDHIKPFAKGGQSTLDNCQILCVKCNLSKSDKQLQEFAMEEKAKAFLMGKSIEEDISQVEEKSPEIKVETSVQNSKKMTKELFDAEIQRFVNEKGDIRSIDFSREKNHLPGITYVFKYYGNLNNLKKAFGIEDISLNWSRERIREALDTFVAKNGDIVQKDFRKANGLPSINCILNFYPEYKDLTDIKRHLCNLDVPEKWTKESSIEAGKRFIAKYGEKITQDKCKVEYGLPSASWILKTFGSMLVYQKLVGSEVSNNAFITIEQMETAVLEYFGDKERVIESRMAFLEGFPYSESSILSKYGSFPAFCKHFGIKVLNFKKGKYSKQEVDEAIAAYCKSGKPMPHHHDLTSLGLPTSAVIMRYYEHWREPFDMFYALYAKVGDNK